MCCNFLEEYKQFNLQDIFCKHGAVHRNLQGCFLILIFLVCKHGAVHRNLQGCFLILIFLVCDRWLQSIVNNYFTSGVYISNNVPLLPLVGDSWFIKICGAGKGKIGIKRLKFFCPFFYTFNQQISPKINYFHQVSK